ncbi:MAG: hypothetical protein ABL892_09630 [Thiobacillaceae bacterium]
MDNTTLDAKADLLAEAALHELGDTLLDVDEPDEYAGQVDYAGCYPWLADVIYAHPLDGEIRAVLYGMDSTESDLAYTC